MTRAPHRHGPEDLCAEGSALYASALREGWVTVEEISQAPCLLEFGLLRPDTADPNRLKPVSPAVALPGLLEGIEEEIAFHRGRETKLAEMFRPLIALDAERASVPENPMISVLVGFRRINDAISGAASAASGELLTIQPGGFRDPAVLAGALPREQDFMARGGHMRTLYQHTARHDPSVIAHFEQLRGDVEVRTLDEVTERLIMFDRSVAFIPANPDRTVALEIRHPALISYLVTTFERLWRLAAPLLPTSPQPTTASGNLSTRQRTIAELLVEGHTDAVIAERLSMNIRTVRLHIAKLAATLGSTSRAQLGYLIGQSGILHEETPTL
ncbi:helix-turn-helix transcriptional regulator [Streptomyces beihaiensis]|uniref:Helix-turn-helix transcriptional regulator n=1 Tax=Streptomyces beihaiensis TaxID=2984495 RepID=A0ABT3TTV9_9ACTN|nr:helix-turn-helix transcriptional regulator [Streptomyces beihaiensis]MCX3060461.1 helix-turn-helix transcriptional regulator [Streptomyces beihaiensis]